MEKATIGELIAPLAISTAIVVLFLMALMFYSKKRNEANAKNANKDTLRGAPAKSSSPTVKQSAKQSAKPVQQSAKQSAKSPSLIAKTHDPKQLPPIDYEHENDEFGFDFNSVNVANGSNINGDNDNVGLVSMTYDKPYVYPRYYGQKMSNPRCNVYCSHKPCMRVCR